VASKYFTEGRRRHLVAEVDLFGTLKLVECAMSSAWSTELKQAGDERLSRARLLPRRLEHASRRIR
jgi:hypothetical protein